MLEGKAVWLGPSLVIDTDSYAGQFERQLTAFVVGELDDERAPFDGEEMINIFREEVGDVNPFEELVTWGLEFDDDIPGVTVCSLYPTPGMSNDGHGNHYQVTEEQPYQYPAYYSVRLFLDREPTPEELALIKERSEKFAVRGIKYQPPFRITGYRLVYERVLVEERQI